MGFDAFHTPTFTLTPIFIFHLVVMAVDIKVGNGLTAVLRYWIQGPGCRQNRRRLGVKSLSSEMGSFHTEAMVSTSKRCGSIVPSDPCEWHTAHLLPYPSRDPLLALSLCLLQPDTRQSLIQRQH